MAKFKTVIVSNRLPVMAKRVNGAITFERSSGGLATAMSSLEGDNKVWVGWPGIASDDLSDDERQDVTTKLAELGCVPVFLSREQIKLYYEGYANDTMWPLMHYFASKAEYHRAYWKAYREVNHLFEAAVRRHAEPDAAIWIHDYHLMMLPRMVRQKLPEARIGYFHHIPFPSYEVFRLLPERHEILEGLLGCDVVGFHIYDYARHFISSVLRILGHESANGVIHYGERTVLVDAFPIGIDYRSFADMRGHEDVISARTSLAETYIDEKIILSVDRLDYSKGIPERLEAYQRFLEEYPQYLGKVRLVMVAVPSRTEVDAYKQLRDQIEITVSRINGEFGTSEWAPISYQFQNLPFAEIVALYAQADVMLVTPLRDGMNLVAKEFAAAKGDEPGVLVLSEMTGAVEELPESIVVNPNDINMIARSIKQALEMSKREQLERLAAMQQRLRTRTVVQWGADFMAALANVGVKSLDSSTRVSAAVRGEIAARFARAKNRLILLDYDGTLQPFHTDISTAAASPSKELLALIKQLATRPNTTVAIVSGRGKSSLEKWFKGIPVRLIAEHGAWMLTDGTWQKAPSDYEPVRALVTPTMEDYAARTPNSQVEQKDFSTVWHYRTSPVQLAQARQANLYTELRRLLAGHDATVHRGNKIIEVRPSEIDKGAAVRQCMRAVDPDFMLVAGDDYTDEDMFSQLDSDGISIKVGHGDTAAKYRVLSVVSMHRLLQALVDSE